MVVAASRNHLYRRRLQVVIDAGPRNHLYLLGQQVKIRSSPRNHRNRAPSGHAPGGVFRLGEVDQCRRRGFTSRTGLLTSMWTVIATIGDRWVVAASAFTI